MKDRPFVGTGLRPILANELMDVYQRLRKGLEMAGQIADENATSQAGRILKSLKKMIHQRSNLANYARRIEKAQEFVGNLKQVHTLKKDAPRTLLEFFGNELWIHHDPRKYVIAGVGNPIYIDRKSLLSLTTTYLENPWLQHNEIAWILLDSLILETLHGTLDAMARRQGDITYLIAGGNWEKINMIKVIKGTLMWIVCLGLVGLLYLLGYETISLIIGKDPWLHICYFGQHNRKRPIILRPIQAFVGF